MSATANPQSSQKRAMRKESKEGYTGKAPSPGGPLSSRASGGQRNEESVATNASATRMVLQHQQSCPSLPSDNSDALADGDPYGDVYSNSTPVSPFHLSLDDEFPDFLFDNINDEYSANGSRNPSASPGSKTVALEDIIRDYSPSASSGIPNKGYNTAAYSQPANFRGRVVQGVGVAAQPREHHMPDSDAAQRLSQQQMSMPSRAPAPSNKARPQVSPQLGMGQRLPVSPEGNAPVQRGAHQPGRNVVQGNVSPQHGAPSSIALSPQSGIASSPVVSPQQRPAMSIPQGLPPRANAPVVSPQHAYSPQQGMATQQYGQMLANLAARQTSQAPAGSLNGANVQDLGSPEMPKSHSPSLYMYRSHSQDSPHDSPSPQPQSQVVFKVPQGSPPMPRRNPKIIQESINSPSYALQFQDMSLNSPRPRSDTVEMGSGADDSYDSRTDAAAEEESKVGLAAGLSHGGLSPTLSDVPSRLRSGTIEMSDSNVAPSSSYASTFSAPQPIETRGRAGTFDMLDAASEAAFVSSHANGVVEQRGRSGTVEMSDESALKGTLYNPALSSPRSALPPLYIQPQTSSRSNMPLSDPSQASVYSSSPTEPPMLPPQVMRIRQQVAPGYGGASDAGKVLSHAGAPPGDMRLYQKQMVAQQMLAQQRYLPNGDPRIVEDRSLPVPGVLHSMENQHYLQQQQQQYLQQMSQSRMLQQQQQQRLLMQQAQQRYKHELEVEQEVAQEFLQEQLFREGGGASSLGNELDNLESTELFGYINSKLEQKLELKQDVSLGPHPTDSAIYPTRQSYTYSMSGSSPRPPAHEPIIILPDGSSFSNPGQYLSNSIISLPDKENYASSIPSLMEQVQSKQETPFQRLRKIAEDISSCVDDVVKFKGKKGDREYQFLAETLQRQLLLLEKVQAPSNDLRSARKALVKEVQELLEILERRAS